MKITTDFTQVVPGRWSALRASFQQGSALKAPDTRAETARAGGSRSAAEAFSITQMAQVVVQKAMEISSRLRSMAMDAMNSGRVNTDELKTISTELQSTLGAYSSRFDTVVIPPSVQATPSRVSVNIRREFAELSEQAARMTDNRAADTGALERASASIERMSRSLDEASRALGRHMGAAQIDNESARGEAARTGSRITGNFDLALRAQGNISRENAVVLLKE